MSGWHVRLRSNHQTTVILPFRGLSLVIDLLQHVFIIKEICLSVRIYWLLKLSLYQSVIIMGHLAKDRAMWVI